MMLRFGIAAVVVVLDQITKVAVERGIAMHEQIPITGFFNLTKAYNPGAAFSFLANAGGWQRWFFTIISAVVSVLLVVWLARMDRTERWLSIAIALILGGAVGNLIDRVLYGHVIDFLQLHWKHAAYFPSFNIADAALTCGTTLMIVLTLFERKHDTDVLQDEPS